MAKPKPAKPDQLPVLTEMSIDQAPPRRPQHAIIKESRQWVETMARIEKDDLNPGKVIRIDCATIGVKWPRKGFADHLKDYIENHKLNSKYQVWTIKREEAVYLERKDDGDLL